MVKRYFPSVKFEQYSGSPEGDMEIDPRGKYVKLSAYEDLERAYLKLKYGKTCFRIAQLFQLSHDSLHELSKLHMEECAVRSVKLPLFISGKEISFKKVALMAECQ